MADERYYVIRAEFDPAIAATLAMPWTPLAAPGDDPGNMRIRFLVEPHVGRFPPDVLGRHNKVVTSLVWIWTDGPVDPGDVAYVLGSESGNPPGVQRTPAHPLVLGLGEARPLQLGPSDQLVIATPGKSTTCYLRVLDLDESDLLVTWPELVQLTNDKPTQIDVGDAAEVGTATTAARADHQHALPAPAAPATVTRAAASAGTSPTVARADHKHDVATATAVTVAGGMNGEGSSTSLPGRPSAPPRGGGATERRRCRRAADDQF